MHGSMTEEAKRSALAHPFHVSLFDGWADHDPLIVGFQDRASAETFAGGRPEPLVDLVERDRGTVAVRRLVAHPAQSWPFSPRDDFPPRNVSPFVQRARARQLPGKVYA